MISTKAAKPALNKAPDKEQPTMADVARHAGVSAMSVSRALKDPETVSPAARQRIAAAIEALGYVLDLSAGSLSSKRTGFVAAIIPSLNNSNFSDTARGITDELEGTGLQLLLGSNDYSIEREEELVEAMLRRRPEGIIVTSGSHTARTRKMLEAAGIPVVETWDVPEQPIDQIVGFSNADAMGLLVRTLASKGYRKFGYIGGTTERDTRGSQRREGFVSALCRMGLTSERLLSFGVPPISMQQGGQAVVEMLVNWPDTEVVICVSDLSAFGAIMECQRRGMKVPGDIAIAGFGNYEIAECCHPRITSVDVDCYNIGRQAARQLHISIKGNETENTPSVMLTQYRVIERESA
jgi:LacI family transcriptional regulator, gluconate utilization system Gnt-I transcriptional repressor